MMEKYILKQIPEDFIVREQSIMLGKEKGKFLYFKLTKRGYGTMEAIKKIADILHLNETNFGFAGNKDKHALTEQICSVFGTTPEKLSALNIKNVTVEIKGYNDSPISLGDLLGNQFEIVIRNLTIKKINSLLYFPNYFDEQRFSDKNMIIGKHLLKKEFKQATELVDNVNCKKHLQRIPTDFVGALRQVSDRMLRMYLNSYQSYLWNETLTRFLRLYGNKVRESNYSLGSFVFVDNYNDFINIKIPIIGFNAEDFEYDKRIKPIIQEIMCQEKIDYSDFIIKQIPILTLEGELRDAFTQIKDMSIGKLEKDELNLGMNKIKLKFTLSKGSYATMVIRSILA